MKIQVNNFDIKQIAESGQCFRMVKLKDNLYRNIAYGKYIEIEQIDKGTIEVSCTQEEWNNVWYRYFDMDCNYQEVIDKINKGTDNFMKQAVKYGSGIRILNQEPFETLISFIISQRKSIPAIKTCVEKICQAYGEQRFTPSGKEYFTFPNSKILDSAKLPVSLGLGYRDDFIKDAAYRVYNGMVNLESLMSISYEECIDRLKSIHGVGIKVANCTALFGLGHKEAFPIDTWIQKIIDNEYNGYLDTKQFGKYGGIIQQYIFYYYRNK